MRIAMIGQKRTGSREGGVEVVVGELARRMADLGHQVTCYDRMGEGAPSEPYEKDGYRIVPVKALDIKGLSALTSSFAATRAAIKDGADVIHYHAEGPCVPLRFARSADIRTVATIHGLDWQRAMLFLVRCLVTTSARHTYLAPSPVASKRQIAILICV